MKGTIDISTNSTLQPDDPDFEVPSLVFQTTATTSSILQPINFDWTSNDTSTEYYLVLHFFEIQTSLIGRREFNILVNGIPAFDTPIILGKSSYWTGHRRSGYTYYNVSLVATSNATLPPLLNAFQLYKIALVGIVTYGADGNFLSIIN